MSHVPNAVLADKEKVLPGCPPGKSSRVRKGRNHALGRRGIILPFRAEKTGTLLCVGTMNPITGWKRRQACLPDMPQSYRLSLW